MLRSSGCSSLLDIAKGPLLFPILLGLDGLVGVGGVNLASLGFVVRSNGDSAVGAGAAGELETILCSCSRGDLGSAFRNTPGLRVPRSVLKG